MGGGEEGGGGWEDCLSGVRQRNVWKDQGGHVREQIENASFTLAPTSSGAYRPARPLIPCVNEWCPQNNTQSPLSIHLTLPISPFAFRWVLLSHHFLSAHFLILLSPIFFTVYLHSSPPSSELSSIQLLPLHFFSFPCTVVDSWSAFLNTAINSVRCPTILIKMSCHKVLFSRESC